MSSSALALPLPLLRELRPVVLGGLPPVDIRAVWRFEGEEGSVVVSEAFRLEGEGVEGVEEDRPANEEDGVDGGVAVNGGVAVEGPAREELEGEDLIASHILLTRSSRSRFLSAAYLARAASASIRAASSTFDASRSSSAIRSFSFTWTPSARA